MPDPDYRLLYLNARSKMDKLLAELEQLRAEMAKETEVTMYNEEKDSNMEKPNRKFK